MDPAVLQAAQRVMAWHLQHFTMPPPLPPSAEEADDSLPPPHDAQHASQAGPSRTS